MDATVQPGLRAALAADVAMIARQSGHAGGLGHVFRYLLLSPAFHFVLGLRLQRAVARVPLIGGVLRRVLHFGHAMTFSSDVSPTAIIGPGLYAPHPFAIVIGDRAVLGRNVSVFQGVTIGQRGAGDTRMGTVGDEAYIGAGAAILGPISVGRGAVVGANAVVLSDVPPGSVAVGNPARIVERQEAAAAA